MVLESFIGSNPSAEGAVEDAIGKANECLAWHQWRTSDGTSCYQMVPTLTTTTGERGNWYTCVLFFYGPAEETELIGPRAYTGATQRLDTLPRIGD